MGADHFITFAYGSNMPTARIKARCPSARALGVAELPGHDLRWHKTSKDGSGKCDIVPTDRQGASVFGVLYEIATDEKPELYKAEGLGAGYEEIDVSVNCGGREVSAKAYQATKTDAALKPYTWYRTLVIAGAKEHCLPKDYIAQIEQVAGVEDTDRERHETNVRLLQGMRT